MPFTALVEPVNTKDIVLETHVKEILVFRGKKVTRGQDAWFYMRTSNNSYNSNWVADPLEAKDLSEEAAATIVKTLLMTKNQDNYDAIELVRMKVTTEITPVNINEGELLEERRRQAIAKLNPLEIEALGVQKLATYDKIKFHGDS